MNTNQAALIDKWIIVLLASNNNDPIKGRIRFTKDFFLIAKKFLPDLYEICQFYPYHFGPYSTRFAERVNVLKHEEIIQARLKYQDWEYYLSDSGCNIASEFIKDIDQNLLFKVSKIKEKNKNLKLRELLKELYLDYPYFAKKAVKRSEYLLEKVNLEDYDFIDDGPGFIASFKSKEREIKLKDEAAKLFLKLLSE